MPWLYHKYAGHDINRDAFMLNLTENQRLAQFFYRVWHPQVFLTMHQMGPRGPRFFVPPNYDPIDPNYDPLLWRTAGLLGPRDGAAARAGRQVRRRAERAVRLLLARLRGLGAAGSQHRLPAHRGRLGPSRAARSTSRTSELHGLAHADCPDYRPQVNFPESLAAAALWRLRDIVDYDLSAVRGLLDGAPRYRRELLENFYAMGRRAVERGRDGGPFAFVDSARPARSACRPRALVEPADRRRRRGPSGRRAVPRRRTRLSGGHAASS